MSWLPYITMFLLMAVGFLLIFIILLQRGRGGGLAGALGGAGGQSAFGTKAGDVFTRITVGLAAVWMLLAAGNVYALRMGENRYDGSDDPVKKADALEEPGGMKGDGASGLPDTKGAEKTPEKTPETPVKDETKPADPATSTEKPADAKPADSKPGDEKPAEPKTDEKPATEEKKPGEDDKQPADAPKPE